MNYLLPQGLATIATDHHKRMVEKHRAKLQEIQKARLAGLRNLADEIGQQSVTIEANANDEGHLYGSVGAADIVNALKRNKFTITADQVRLKGPLKELGPVHGQDPPRPRDRGRGQGLGRADGRGGRRGRVGCVSTGCTESASA